MKQHHLASPASSPFSAKSFFSKTFSGISEFPSTVATTTVAVVARSNFRFPSIFFWGSVILTCVLLLGKMSTDPPPVAGQAPTMLPTLGWMYGPEKPVACARDLGEIEESFLSSSSWSTLSKYDDDDASQATDPVRPSVLRVRKPGCAAPLAVWK